MNPDLEAAYAEMAEDRKWKNALGDSERRSKMRIDSESIQVKLLAVPKVRRAGWLLLSIGFIFLEVLFGCSDSHPVTGSISGSIAVPGSQSGTIYVLAIPAENTRNGVNAGNGVRLRYFVILLLRPSTTFFSNQLYDKVPRKVNLWFPLHNGRLHRKGRPVNT